MGESMDWDEADPNIQDSVIHEDSDTGEHWLVYYEGSTEGNFEDWLEMHKPSLIYKKRHNVDWICVSRQREVRDDLNIQVAAMIDAWEKLDSSSGRPRNEKTVMELVRNFNVTSGKWLFFVDSGGKGDHLWSVVARGIINGTLTCESAKISSLEDDSDQHVICMYNPDCTDMDQVMEAESSIRKLGIKCCMQYKPDAYTYLGVYGRNPWGMYPYIMKSNFDITKGVSVIKDNFG